MRVLGVDPGSKNIGLALSDPTGAIANPLMILKHISRTEDVARVSSLARQYDVEIIVIGQSLDDSGNPNFEGRRAMRFARSLQETIGVRVVLFDEAFTTQEARAARIEMNVSRKNRRGHLDSLAAVILLQSYLDEANSHTRSNNEKT